MHDSDTPVNLRPDLTLLGIDEYQRGMCVDNEVNKHILRLNKLRWNVFYTAEGEPTDFLEVYSPEMQASQAASKIDSLKAIMKNPKDINSDYIQGYDLILAEEAADVTPPWVFDRTRDYLKYTELLETDPARAAKRLPAFAPGRCAFIKSDGIRCQRWHGHRDVDGLCALHLGLVIKRKVSIEHSRLRLMEATDSAIDGLLALSNSAESEPVRLKANTEILDRAGLRAGFEIDSNVTVDATPAAQILSERLSKLRMNSEKNAEIGARPSTQAEIASEDAIVVAEVIEDE